MKYVSFLFLLLLFAGCSSKHTLHVVKYSPDIYDLGHIPQDVDVYASTVVTNKGIDENLFLQHYFKIWNITTLPYGVQTIKWPFKYYTYPKVYGENLQPLEQSFFDSMYDNCNFKAYATLNKRAITLHYSNIRAFPTNRPVLRDPRKAGEGFPFDYMQVSSIEANKPLFVSHYSKDRKWVYVYSSFTSGWMKANEIVFVDDDYVEFAQESESVFIVKEGKAIYDAEGHFLFQSRIGMRLPLVSEDDTSYTVLVVSKYKANEALYLEAKISKEIGHKNILEYSSKNVATIIKEVSKTDYSWGGLYGQRDCSSTLRDYFAPFGIWLPRNSSKQSKVGDVVSFAGLDEEQKTELIKEKAEPFKTLLYKKGHIMLYVGIYNDDIIIFQNVWGIKTKSWGKEGRIIIGKPIFSTLYLGKHQSDFDADSSIIKNLKSMNTVIN